VETKNEFVAREIVLQQYGRKKIKIDKIDEVKDVESVDTSNVE
jgi:hypothetical protein